jgi:hypothetical protein
VEDAKVAKPKSGQVEEVEKEAKVDKPKKLGKVEEVEKEASAAMDLCLDSSIDPSFEEAEKEAKVDKPNINNSNVDSSIDSSPDAKRQRGPFGPIGSAKADPPARTFTRPSSSGTSPASSPIKGAFVKTKQQDFTLVRIQDLNGSAYRGKLVRTLARVALVERPFTKPNSPTHIVLVDPDGSAVYVGKVFPNNRFFFTFGASWNLSPLGWGLAHPRVGSVYLFRGELAYNDQYGESFIAQDAAHPAEDDVYAPESLEYALRLSSLQHQSPLVVRELRGLLSANFFSCRVVLP